jgi:hypothetical protein
MAPAVRFDELSAFLYAFALMTSSQEARYNNLVTKLYPYGHALLTGGLIDC